MRILAIDPGNTESGWVVIDADNYRPVEYGKTPNDKLRDRMRYGVGEWAYISWTYIEMISSFGKPVGREIFETCVWVGRFLEVAPGAGDATTIYRRDVKAHHCKGAGVTDADVTRALVDRFTPGQPNYGKGTKAEPGFFHGFKKDIWQAYALAVYVVDREKGLA